MTYEKYIQIHVTVKKYLRPGSRFDPHWLINSNLAPNLAKAKIIANIKGRSLQTNAIIFFHYPNECWTNVRGNKARFTEEELSDFHSFIRKKIKASLRRNRL